MNLADAVSTFAALAQQTRLAVFRLLVEAGHAGMNAGAIAARLGLPPATLSFHIAHLERAGLVKARQQSRFIYYSANFAAIDDLIAFLAENCCQGGGHCLPKAATTTAARSSRSSRKVA